MAWLLALAGFFLFMAMRQKVSDSQARLSIAQMYNVALAAGFPPATAQKMVAIAMRESGGNPNAFNGKPPDESYGLWQINMLNAPERMKLFSITDKNELFDPAVNARAAFKLWAGNDKNLARHWATEKTGAPYFYAEKYQANLAKVQAELGGIS